MNDGIGAVITGKADIACGVAFTWGRSTQVNFRIGANKDPQATGFSYRISVQGCH